jgi:hypothetical protein
MPALLKQLIAFFRLDHETNRSESVRFDGKISAQLYLTLPT